MREAYHFTEMGECVLAGRPVGKDLAGMKHYAARLSLIGVGVLVVGLGGGWVLTTRSIRPIEQISGAAKRISEGQLSERIQVEQPGSELGQLAEVLNSTFARLEDSFAQQKRFTADASHELRTPLSVLIAETQTVLSRERPAEEYREVLAGNLDTARQMKRLAEALLELARIDTGEKWEPGPPLEIGVIADEVIGRLRPLAKARNVSITREGESAMTGGSPERLALVISNLLENAIHHGRDGGSVVVSTGHDEDVVTLQVSDDGPGIPEQDLPHVFERFYRADKSRTGSQGRYGLGLAICRGLVEAEGGSISVKSERGKGACFTVKLPTATC
jgi:heavy metal sensor kinase